MQTCDIKKLLPSLDDDPNLQAMSREIEQLELNRPTESAIPNLDFLECDKRKISSGIRIAAYLMTGHALYQADNDSSG